MDCFSISKTSKIYQAGVATFAFILLSFSSYQASAESSSPVTVEMVDNYLDQALDAFSNQKIQRYEKGYLETAGIRSKYPLLKDKKEYLKADLSMVYMTPEEKKEYRAAFEKNIQLYRKLTGLNIRMTTQQERNVYFNMVITKTDVTAIASYKGFKNYFYGDLKGDRLKAKIAEDRNENRPNIMVQFVRDIENSINLTICVISKSNFAVKKYPKAFSMESQMNRLFFESFVHAPRFKGLASVNSGTRKNNNLQPIDIAYVKAFYSDKIHSGMDVKRAKPIIKDLMLKYLNL